MQIYYGIQDAPLWLKALETERLQNCVFVVALAKCQVRTRATKALRQAVLCTCLNVHHSEKTLVQKLTQRRCARSAAESKGGFDSSWSIAWQKRAVNILEEV